MKKYTTMEISKLIEDLEILKSKGEQYVYINGTILCLEKNGCSTCIVSTEKQI